MNRQINVFVLFIILCQSLIGVTLPLYAQKWVRTNSRGMAPVYALVSQGSTIYASLYDAGGGTIDSSTNGGSTWASSTPATSSFPFLSFAINGKILIGGTPSAGQWRSTNGGISWIQMAGIPSGTEVSSMRFMQKRFFAAAWEGVFISSDDGVTWDLKLKNDSSTNHALPNGFCEDGTNVYVSTQQGAYFSTNNGDTWSISNIGIADSNLSCVESNGLYVFVGTASGLVFRSSNHGASWTAINNGLTNSSSITGLYVNSNLLVAATKNGDLYFSRDYGQNWQLDTTALGGSYVHCYASDGIYLYAGVLTGTGGVWQCSLDRLNSVRETQTNNGPEEFTLEQNYPNPFNPSTTISFYLPSKSFVSIKVFDVIGRVVATIVSQEMSAGKYSKQWNAANISSGIYFYRLQADSYSETKKLLLLK